MNKDDVIKKYNLSKYDLERLSEHEVNLLELDKQVEQIKNGTKYIKLVSSCKIDDGILKVDESQKDAIIKLYDISGVEKETLKFVPASGAASRMFKRIESFMNSDADVSVEELRSNSSYKYIYCFFNNLEKFAFYDDLKNAIHENGEKLSDLLVQKKLKLVLEYLLTDKGLGYSFKPKALIKFHKYIEENRTPFEEQVIEAIDYIKNDSGSIKLHFTISPELKAEFEREKDAIIKKLTDDINPNITYSFQKKSTDTIALDRELNLFRDESEILLRPGGHGALIQNLNEIDADIIFIKNIDNVQRQENVNTTVEYKKLLGGLLLKFQKEIHSYLSRLETNSSAELSKEVIKFIEQKLGYHQIDKKVDIEELKTFLNRPIRVCGVVVNEGHPGGGPFWVEDDNGNISKQIIEGDQVNKSDSEQYKIFQSSTHFNPVDIVCSVKDYEGQKFDLRKYVDDSAILVATKSYKGKELKALELPGLWNGAMADWITVFVEVPKETFTPVKEANDLLKEYHQ